MTRTLVIHPPTYMTVIIAWDCYAKLERWRGEINADEPMVRRDGLIRFARADGEEFYVNPSASRLQYIQVIKENACQ